MKKSVDILPILENILGAYLDGSLSPDEAVRVEQLIASDETLTEILEIVEEVDSAIDVNASIYDDFPDFDETFCLPDVSSVIEPVVGEIEEPEDDDMTDDCDLDVELDDTVSDDVNFIDTDDFMDCM